MEPHVETWEEEADGVRYICTATFGEKKVDYSENYFVECPFCGAKAPEKHNSKCYCVLMPRGQWQSNRP